MASGRVYRPKYRDKGGRVRQAAVWWIDYTLNGKRHRESSKSTARGDAETLLARRVATGRAGGPLPSEAGLVQFETLADLLREDYQRKGNRSSPEGRLRHLSAFFGGKRAADITEPEIDRYIARRLKQGAAHATVNRELAALRRALRLGRRARLVAQVPAVEMLGESKPRQGFVTEAELQRLLSELPEHLRPLVEFLYLSAWRVGDALSRDWTDVDFTHGFVRIEGADTKEGYGRQLPLFPRLRALLEAQRERADAIEASTGQRVEPLFFYYASNRRARPGARIRDFRTSWRSACERAGLGGLLVHDLRRAGVRSLLRAGLSEHMAMKFSGHRTTSVLRRYDIISEADLADAGAKVQQYFDNGTAPHQPAKPAGNGKVSAQSRSKSRRKTS